MPRPGPSLLARAVTCPQSAGASRGLGLRSGPARGAWAAAGRTDSAPGSRGRLSARRRAASFLLAGGRVGVLLQPLYSALGSTGLGR